MMTDAEKLRAVREAVVAERHRVKYLSPYMYEPKAFEAYQGTVIVTCDKILAAIDRIINQEHGDG